MRAKIVALLGSIRFWVITLGAASAFLAGVEKSGFNLASLLDTITVWLAAVAGVGTLDSIAEKFGIKK